MTDSKAKKPTIQRTALVRVFRYLGLEMPDPDPAMEPRDVRDLFAAAGRPELGTAEIQGPEHVGNTLQFTFHLKAGSKGFQEDTDNVQLEDELEDEDGYGEYGEVQILASQKPLLDLQPDQVVLDAIAKFGKFKVSEDPAVANSLGRLVIKDETRGGCVTAPSTTVPWFF